MITKKRDLFVNSIGMVPIAEQTVIPTSVWYSRDETKIGNEAYASASNASDVCENFKIQLGEQEHGATNPRSVKLADGKYHSIHSIASDYLRNLVDSAERWVAGRGLVKAKRVLIAEPVAIHEQGAQRSDWLINYRTHIRRILESRFEDVDFLPEPFAVFQYYRYGLKHPLVAEKKKHVALVLDFGGGTFDVSVIETTAGGDVSNSGRNSRPLAASSVPVGGFFFNRVIAEFLLLKQFSGKKVPTPIHDALRKYDEVRRNPTSRVEDLRADYQHFYQHFTNLLFAVEKAKIAVCSIIKNWDLENTPGRPAGYIVNVPASPLTEKTELSSIRLDELELRDLFVKRIWDNKLKPEITNALTKANGELDGQSISVMLLSGGSANIGWLSSLLSNYSHRLTRDAHLLALQGDFQEIVAKGLAIECARKTFNDGDGDFKAVTYNRLCLVLDPDKRGFETVKYRPIDTDIDSSTDGVLLPSASILQNHVDGALTWKFRLSHPPRQRMDYFFLSSSFDPNEHINVHNVVDHTVITPAATSFDSSLQLKLEVKKDGTATPTFIYRSPGLTTPGVEIKGRSFFIDMTFGGADGSSEAYLGVDFGTSNSSISYVDKDSITVYAERANDPNWDNINEIVGALPYPIASPLASYMASAGNKDLDLRAIDVIEGFLTFAAYVAYSEFTTLKSNKSTKQFKGFTQRSTGPLWALLRQCIGEIKGRAYFAKSLERLFEEPIYSELNAIVNAIGQVKHNKADTPPDYMRAIRLLGNIFSDYCGKFKFGYFEDVQKKKFGTSYQGKFRSTSGSNAPFINIYNYEGPHPFSEDQSVLLCTDSGQALLLEPIMFWHKADSATGHFEADLYCFDIHDKGNYSFKVVGRKGVLNTNENENFADLKHTLDSIKEEDPKSNLLENLKISD